MKAIFFSRLVVAAPLFVSALAVAQVSPYGNSSSVSLELPPEPPLNRFGLSYRMGFNISATFSGLGGFQSPNNPGPPTGGGLDRTYDDGYNRRDVSPDDGLTWYWGYANYSTPGIPSQISGDSLLLHVSSAEANGVARGRDAEPLHGFELTYQRRISKSEDWHWGIELAFNFTSLEIVNTRPICGTVTTITDAYALGGIIPPHAPPPDMAYEGTFLGPGALISDTPWRRSTDTVPHGALTTGRRNLDATIYGFRLGPYLQVPPTNSFSISFSAGLAVALVDSEFQFSETTTISAIGKSSLRSGRDARCDVLAGWFAAGQCSLELNEQWSLFSGVQYQDVGHFSQSAAGAKATLNLSQSVFVTFGVGFRF